MARDGPSTRERILETAHEMVLRQGYAATSLDQILDRTGVTKGAFFHHFKSKDELARALFERYLGAEDQFLQLTLRRAEKLTTDPLQQVLVALGLVEEIFDGLQAPHPGCLIASYLYQNELMTPEATAKSRAAFSIWRDALATKLRAAAKTHPPRMEPDYEAIGDMLNVVIEGAMITSKLFDDPKILVRQLRQLRAYVELLFGIEPKQNAR